MSYELISKCPICNENLIAKKLQCSNCNTIVENDFRLPKLLEMDKEQLKFIEVFLKCRGSIKEVEKELGISYPTVRNKLDEIVLFLGGNENKTIKPKESVIEMLDKGEITAEDAINMLKKK